jgi:hypothetical protein
LGIIFDNIGIGVSLGLIAATIVQMVNERKQKVEGAGVGLAIAVGGLLLIIAILAAPWL